MAEETLLIVLAIGLGASLLLIWIVAYVDLARRKDLSIMKKAIWAVVMFFGAYIGIAAYFIMRPIPEVAGKGLNPTTSESSRVVNTLESLHTDHTDGSIADAAYLEEKRNLLGLT
jgi:beta-lactamase regulating signal transducer with metallopeptidase domain